MMHGQKNIKLLSLSSTEGKVQPITLVVFSPEWRNSWTPKKLSI